MVIYVSAVPIVSRKGGLVDNGLMPCLRRPCTSPNSQYENTTPAAQTLVDRSMYTAHHSHIPPLSPSTGHHSSHITISTPRSHHQKSISFKSIYSWNFFIHSFLLYLSPFPPPTIQLPPFQTPSLTRRLSSTQSLDSTSN